MSHITSVLLDKFIMTEVQYRFHTFSGFLTKLSSMIKDASNLSDISLTICNENYSFRDILEMLCRNLKSDIASLESHITPQSSISE